MRLLPDRPLSRPQTDLVPLGEVLVCFAPAGGDRAQEVAIASLLTTPSLAK